MVGHRSPGPKGFLASVQAAGRFILLSSPTNTTSGPPAPAWASSAFMSPQARPLPMPAELSPSSQPLFHSQSPYLFLLPPSPPPPASLLLAILTSPGMGLLPFSLSDESPALALIPAPLLCGSSRPLSRPRQHLLPAGFGLPSLPIFSSVSSPWLSSSRQPHPTPGLHPRFLSPQGGSVPLILHSPRPLPQRR